MNINDQQGSQSWKLIFKIIVHHAVLGCAKEKIIENPDYFFRLQFEYKTDMNAIEGIKIKSSKQKLKENEMTFNNELISFPNVNIEQGLIEIRMIIGTLSIGKRFNPSIIMLKDLIIDIEDQVIWKFSANSIVTLAYKLESSHKKSNNNDYQLQETDLDNITKAQLPGLQKERSTISALAKSFSEFSNKEIQNEQSELRESYIKDKISTIEKTLKKVNSSNMKKSINNADDKLIEGSNILRTQSQKIIPSNVSMEIKSSVVLEQTNQPFESFCQGFFITSFPPQSGQIIENSKSYASSCKHKVCSILPAIEPEILYRFPFEDSKDLELNNLAASICFPSGIKICYEQKTDPITPKNYLTPITNQQGDRYYMMIYHYYLKLEFTEYNKEYLVQPLKYFLKKFGENYYDILEINEEEKAQLEDELDICMELGFSEYVYIPFAFALIAKFPYIKAMESCLNSIMQILINEKDSGNLGSEVGQIVSFLINSFPIPPPNSKVVFRLPYEISQIEVEGPVYKDKFFSHINLDILLSTFSIGNIIQIYKLLILEQKMLFVAKEHSDLSQITEAFLSLLFPIEWVHTYIPIMSDKMTQYLQTFLPFVNGINENLISQALSSLTEAEEGIYIVYINSNTVCFSKETKKGEGEGEGEAEEETKLNVSNIPDLPMEIKETLKKKLYEIKSIKSKAILNLCIRNTFIEAFSSMFYDFKDYLYKMDDSIVFSTKMLLENRNEEDHDFYQDITETQLFITFIQNLSKNEDDYLYFINILNKLKSNEESTCLNRFKHTNNQTEVLYSYIKHNMIHCTYVIRPPFREPKMPHLQRNKTAFGLSNQPPQILTEGRRVITKPFKLKDSDYPSVIERYFIPGAEKSIVNKRHQTIFKKVDLIEKSIEMNKTQTIIERNKKVSELTSKQKEDIKEIIIDTLTSIFQSKVDINITPALQEIYRSFGRECFCKWVYQNNSIKKIQPDCFNQLVKLFLNGLISMCNINENDITLDCAVRLTKSSFYYCKGNTGDFLYDELKMKLKDYFLWIKDSFWFKWLEGDAKERNSSIEKEQNYVTTIELICDKMLKLQISKEFIIKFINSLLETHLSKNPLFEEVKRNLNKQIRKCKYFEVNVLKDPMNNEQSAI